MASERLGASFSIDVTDLKAGLTQANRLIRESESEFKAAAAGLDDWSKSEDGINARIKSLNEITDVQKKKVNALKAEYQNLIDNGLDPTSREAVELRTKINNEEAALASNEKELKKQTAALKDVEKGTDEAGNGFSKFGEMAKAAGKVAAAAIGAASAAVGALLKSSIEGYAEYEQLVGGVETLFADSVEKSSEYIEEVGTKALQAMPDDLWEKLGEDVLKNAKVFEMWGDDVGSAMDAVADGMTYGLGTGVADVDGYIEYIKDSYGLNAEEAKNMAEAVSNAIQSNIGSLGDYGDALSGQSEAAKMLIENANNAYKTAGMSANEYISNVTGFSAALISSLGGDTVKAAETADRAMRDMSDNANKMGTSLDSIVQTYQSLSKGNFQMLDNLKLGYGGTKTEMERLIADAAKMTDIQDELNISVQEGDMSFANMVNAISVVQTKMGITGTTAREAATTIQGSFGMMQSSWANLVAGIADENANVDQLITNLIDSIGAVAANVLPRATIAVDGIIKMVEGLLPQLPPLIEQFLPIVIEGAMNLLAGIVEVLPTIIDTILEVIPQLITAIIAMLPTLISTMTTIVVEIINSLAGMLPTIIDAIMEILPLLITAFVSAIPQLIDAAINLLMAIVEAIPTIITELTKQLPMIIQTILQALYVSIPKLISGAIQLFMAILDALPVIITALTEQLPMIIHTIIYALVYAIPQLVNGAIQLFLAILDAIPVIIDALIENLPTIIDAIITGLLTGIDALIDGAIKLFMAILEAIPIIIPQLIEKIPEIITTIVDALLNGIPKIIEVGGQIVSGIWEGIKGAGKWLWEQVSGFFGGIVDGICGFLGIASPSKLMENLVGKNMALGIGEGFENEMQKVNKQINNAIQIDDVGINATVSGSMAAENNANGKSVVVYQTNNYAQAHSRYELYKSKQQTLAAVQLAMAGA